MTSELRKLGGLMRVFVACLAVYICIPIVSLAQKTLSVQVGGGATSMSWISFTIEAEIHSFDKESLVQSFAVSTGYGLPMFNATFIPMELHTILFHGNDHLDVALGANFQVRYKQPNSDGWKDLQYSPINPTSSLSYRFEPENGGFCFRIGLGAMYAVADAIFIPQSVIGFGWTF